MNSQNNQDFEIPPPLLPSKMVATLCAGNKRPEPCLSEAYIRIKYKTYIKNTC